MTHVERKRLNIIYVQRVCSLGNKFDITFRKMSLKHV